MFVAGAIIPRFVPALSAGAHALRQREDSMGFRRSAAVLVMLAGSAPVAVALSAPQAQTGSKPASSAPAASAPASASSATAPASAESASKAAACGACHGMDGNSTDAQYPKLANQNEQYIVTQLMRFKTGVRQNAIMQ